MITFSVVLLGSYQILDFLVHLAGLLFWLTPQFVFETLVYFEELEMSSLWNVFEANIYISR